MGILKSILNLKFKKSALEVALDEVKKQGEKPVVKGVEQLDEYFRKHPYNPNKKSKKKKH